jgi:hypothetical protein
MSTFTCRSTFLYVPLIQLFIFERKCLYSFAHVLQPFLFQPFLNLVQGGGEREGEGAGTGEEPLEGGHQEGAAEGEGSTRT